MADPYEEEFYGDEVYYEPAPQRGMSGWLIALIVVLVVLLRHYLVYLLDRQDSGESEEEIYYITPW